MINEIKYYQKLLDEFENKFGFKAYNKILDILSKLYMRIQRLTTSRDNWKRKYFNLKNKR